MFKEHVRRDFESVQKEINKPFAKIFSQSPEACCLPVLPRRSPCLCVAAASAAPT